jgi:organic radical activating enzyme
MMRRGEWPEQGCEYCRKIEDSGGTSDRQMQLTNAIYDVPPELLNDETTNEVTPTVLEVYFSNVCNMSCLYCGPHFSSMWEAENNKFGNFHKHPIYLSTTSNVGFNENYDEMVDKFFKWFEKHHSSVTHFHILGGEAFYQPELELCLDFFDKNPSPNTQFSMISNLKVGSKKFNTIIDRMILLKDQSKIQSAHISASLDCWGKQQEYVRYGLDLNEFETNMKYMLDKDVVISINAAINALSIKTMPEYISKINEWNSIRNSHGFGDIHFSFMSVNMNPDMFDGDLFKDDFEKVINLMPNQTEAQKNALEHMKGIANQIEMAPKNPEMIKTLKIYLDEIDRRRNTNWRELFPWLENQ